MCRRRAGAVAPACASAPRRRRARAGAWERCGLRGCVWRECVKGGGRGRGISKCHAVSAAAAAAADSGHRRGRRKGASASLHMSLCGFQSKACPPGHPRRRGRAKRPTAKRPLLPGGRRGRSARRPRAPCPRQGPGARGPGGAQKVLDRCSLAAGPPRGPSQGPGAAVVFFRPAGGLEPPRGPGGGAARAPISSSHGHGVGSMAFGPGCKLVHAPGDALQVCMLSDREGGSRVWFRVGRGRARG